MTVLVKELARKKRHRRVRKKVFGTPERPRLVIFRSNKNIYAQAIDDLRGATIVSASSLDKELKGEGTPEKKAATAEKVGALIAQRLQKKNISKAVFDRNGYRFHGRVKSLAEGAREKGLMF